MKIDIPGHFCYITGERASEALDYILNQEHRMMHQGDGNPYFSDDFAENMSRFYREAAEKFSVQIFDSFSDRILAGK